jgi:hypothetical protein
MKTCAVRLVLKPVLSFACSFLLCEGPAHAASPVTITFDDLRPTWDGYALSSPVPSGYSGLQWNNFRVLDPMDPPGNFAGFGYQNGVVSMKNLVYNDRGAPAFLSSGAPFDLNSAYLTGAYVNGLQVEVKGYIGSALTYDNTYTVDETSPTLITLNCFGVDEAEFISSNFNNFVMDNLTITVPEPTEMGLLSMGWFFVWRMVRRKKPASP